MLVLERMGQLMRDGVVELEPGLDGGGDDDDAVARKVERTADAIEPRRFGVWAEGGLRGKQAGELVEFGGGAFQPLSRLLAGRMQGGTASIAAHEPAADRRESRLAHHHDAGTAVEAEP